MKTEYFDALSKMGHLCSSNEPINLICNGILELYDNFSKKIAEKER